MAAQERSAPSLEDVDGGPLTDALVQVAFVTIAALTRLGAENDLSLTQLRVLAILRDRRPRMAALADHLGLERSTMTGLVDRAEKRGLLARAPNPVDGRAVDVFLTPAGAALADRLHQDVVTRLAPSTGGLAPPERRLLLGMLEGVLAAVES